MAESRPATPLCARREPTLASRDPFGLVESLPLKGASPAISGRVAASDETAGKVDLVVAAGGPQGVGGAGALVRAR